jgi:hypothetical protein
MLGLCESEHLALDDLARPQRGVYRFQSDEF